MSEETVVTRRRGRPAKRNITEVMDGQDVQEINGGPVLEEAPLRSIKQDLLTEGENKELLDLASAIEQFSDSNGKICVFRQGPLGSLPYIAEMPVKAFSMEYVKEEFGGGDYVLQFKTSEGKFFKRLPLKIDPIFKPRQVREEEARRLAAATTGIPATAHAEQADKTAVIIQLMQGQLNESKQMFQLMLTQQMESQKSMMLMIGKIFEGNRGGVGPSFSSQATVIEALTPLLLKQIETRPGGSPTGLLDDVDKLLKLKLLFSGDNDKDEPDMLEKVMKLLGPAAASLLGRAMPVQVQQVAPVAQQIPNQTGEVKQVQPEPPKILGVIEQLRMALPLLLNAARKGSAPESYYEFVSDNLNDDLYDELAVILEKDDWCEVLFASPPEILADNNVKEWFEKLRQLFLEESGSGAAPEPQEA